MQLDVIGRLAGSTLVAGLVVYIYVSLNSGRQDGGEDEDEDESASGSTLSRDVFGAVLGMATLTIGAHFMVNGAMGIAADFGIPETVIGIVLLALGTSLPELTVTVVALSRGKADLALRNVLGSTLFNLLGILGVAALVRPLVVPQSAADVHVWVMAGACAIACVRSLTCCA
jgi:cation:H+ antiporter